MRVSGNWTHKEATGHGVRAREEREQFLPNAKGSSPEGIVLRFVPSTKDAGNAYHTPHIYYICTLSVKCHDI